MFEALETLFYVGVVLANYACDRLTSDPGPVAEAKCLYANGKID